MELRQIYKQLTAIDISEQMQIWDERGKGYYGEYLLFCELYKHIIGQGKILMNLKIPVDDKKMTEIDLLLIHETGFYVFEIKHYKGTIYGKDKDHTWTQYFRTSKNKTFVNPIEQNGYHIRALRAMFPDIPVHSFIVFTSDECDIKVENSNSEIDVCLLRQVKNKLTLRFQAFDKKLTMETMDQFFTRLSVYSQMSEKVKIGVSEAPFYAWVQPILDKLEDEIAKLEEAEANRREFAEINRRKLIEELELEKYKIEQEKKKIEQDWKKIEYNRVQIKKQKRSMIYCCLAAVLCCVFITLLFIYSEKSREGGYELNVSGQKFVRIVQNDNKYIEDLNSYAKMFESC